MSEEKPCNLPCPKCGSDDIWRQFFSKGEKIKNDKYNEKPFKWTAGQSWYYEVVCDLIKHHCKCCQYEWVGKPLPIKAKK